MIVFSDHHQRILDHGRAFVEQKIIREAEAVEALHEMHEAGDDEDIRLAKEAHSHAVLMTSAAFLELYGSLLDIAREEVAMEQVAA